MNGILIRAEQIRADGSAREVYHISREEWERQNPPAICVLIDSEEGVVVKQRVTTRESIEYMLSSKWLMDKYSHPNLKSLPN